MLFNQTMDGLTAFLIRNLGYRASINNTNISFLTLTCCTYTCFFQCFTDG